MSNMQKSEGRSAFEADGRRADNPYPFGTHEWTDWKDGFDQAEAGREQLAFRRQTEDRFVRTI